MKAYLFFLIVITSAMGCKPDACLDVSKAQAKLGEPISFINCSDKDNSHYIDYDEEDFDPNNDRLPSIFKYRSPGIKNVRLTVRNKTGTRKDETIVSIAIEAPDKSELLGAWEHYLTEIYEVEFYEEDVSEYYEEHTLIASFSENRTISFQDNLLTIDTNNYTWELADDSIKYENQEIGGLMDIEKLFGNELILKTYASGVYGIYELLYLRKP